MRITWRTEWPNWVVIAGMFLLAAFSWPSAPDRFPVHWNWQGQADRFGDKVEGLLMLPALTLGIYLLLLFLPRIDPGRANYPRFAGTYAVIRYLVTIVMALIYVVSVMSARGYPVDTSLVIPLLVGAMLVVLGNYMGKLRPNWFVGIRTPWTLTSKKSWAKTHRMGGWMFIAVGLMVMAAGVLRTLWAFQAMTVALLVLAVWMFVYSYLVWRTDPDRGPAWPSR